MVLDEYRESVDMDFLCASQDGYRQLRESVFSHGILGLFPSGMETVREVRSDRDGIRAILRVDGVPVKFEIVREARIPLTGVDVPGFPVPCLSQTDMFAEKLLANADRYGDKSVMSRDIIDLIVMQHHWGEIPASAWAKSEAAYGNSVRIAYGKALDLLRHDRHYLDECIVQMGIDEKLSGILRCPPPFAAPQ
jgi:hypothetical protein